MENDRTLLRPFDLEAAKAGEPICWPSENTPVTFIGACSKGAIAYETEHNRGFTYQEALRMAPLCWIEGKPVYKWDALYCVSGNYGIEVTGYNPRVKDNSGLIGKVFFSKLSNIIVGNDAWEPFDLLTWTKPVTKVKKEGWINLYRLDSHDIVLATSSGVFVTKEEAALHLRGPADYFIATVPVEWEEEAK